MSESISSPLTLPAVLRSTALRFPGRPAYIEGAGSSTRSVTWSEMQARISDVAAGLISMGLQRGDRVAICGENSIDWLVAYFATVSAGGTGVLVYFELKAGEIREQVSRPDSRFLFASESVLAKLPDGIGVERVIILGATKTDGGALSLDSVAAAATPESREELTRREPGPDDLAAIIYTSGTTGGAKGVMLSHGNFLSNGRAALQVLDLSAADSVLLVLPLHHAMPFIATCVLVPILGAKLVMENDLRRIRDRMQEQQPTIFFGVPALFELMYRNILARAEAEGRLKLFLKLQSVVRFVKRVSGVNLGHIVFKQVHKALGGKLRFVVSGGAALNPQTALDFFSLGIPLLQGWGMTEASPAVAVQSFSQHRFRFSHYYEQHVGSVGPAVPGVEVRLVDVPDKGILVAESGEGEVFVRGPNVFKGYWEAPEATLAAMQDGWLRTGDLGRIDKDGNIYLTGRSKYIIVLDSGEKVHPDEVEAKLAESPLITDVCVTDRKIGARTLVTAIIYPNAETVTAEATAPEAALDASQVSALITTEVQRLCRELATYKRVARIELTDMPLPKTALRKVARGQLQDEYSFDYERWKAQAEDP